MRATREPARERAVPAGRVVLRLGDLSLLRVTVLIVDYVSVLSMTLDAIAGMHRGLPDVWRQQLTHAVADLGHRAIRPLGAGSSPGWTPECLFPFSPRSDMAAEDSIDLLRSADPHDVGENLIAEFGDAAPTQWRHALDGPGEWIRACGDALQAVMSATAPLRRQAQPLYAREVERLGVAHVRGGTAAALATLNSRIAYESGALVFSHAVPGEYELGGRELVLTPMVTGDRMVVTNFDDPERVWIGYPAPGLGPLWNGSVAPPPAGDLLVALLGSVRAAVLTLLNRSATMGDLALAAGCHPNQITLGCDRLVAAGLIDRRRHGRTVRVSRTDLGDQLVAMYR